MSLAHCQNLSLIRLDSKLRKAYWRQRLYCEVWTVKCEVWTVWILPAPSSFSFVSKYWEYFKLIWFGKQMDKTINPTMVWCGKFLLDLVSYWSLVYCTVHTGFQFTNVMVKMGNFKFSHIILSLWNHLVSLGAYI